MNMWMVRLCVVGAAVSTVVAGLATGINSAQAADLGGDMYRADQAPYEAAPYDYADEGRRYATSRRRHPQVGSYDRYDDGGGRYAYRDDRSEDRFQNRFRNHNFDDEDTIQSPYGGSLKDDNSSVRPDWNRDLGLAPDEQNWRRSTQCRSERAIRRQLRRAGWRGFRRGHVRGNVGYVQARQRGTGETYELAVDRCTGEVISAACIGPGNRRFRNDVAARW